MTPQGKNYSVLLVNRELDDPHFLKKCLEESREFPSRLDRVTRIDEALSKIEHRPYDLLLLESEFEGETFAALEKIRASRIPIPFVLLLPVKDERILREAIRCGVADVIVKSEAQFQQLAQRLQKSHQTFMRRNPSMGHRRKSDFSELDFSGEENTKADLSVRDELTGLYSHGYLFERVVREFSTASRYNYPLSCVMLDIDGFSKINEDFGYFAGERLLKEAATLLFENCRMSDFIARYAGKNFCMVLPHSGYEGAKELALRLKSLFSNHIFLAEEHDIRITICVGVSSFPSDPIQQRGDMIQFADEALQFAKTLGRNRINLYKDVALTPRTKNADMPPLKVSEEKVNEFQKRMNEINQNFQKSFSEACKALVLALENKDKHTVGHSASTANYSVLTAQAMGMNREECEMVRVGTLLHDIGKICVPDSILLKPGRLTLAEFEVMKQHTTLGYQMLKPFRFLKEESLVVLHHHEWFNGEGYPSRLKGDEIPIAARIASVVDSYDTIRSAGARYKRTSTVEDTVNELIACSGTQFDPKVVQAFIGVLKSRGEISAEQNINYQRLDEILSGPQPDHNPQE